MKKLAWIGLGALTLLGAQLASAQEGLAGSIIAARQKNAQLMKQYSWNTRIELIEDGTVKDTRIDQVTYGPDGNLQYTLLNDQGASLPHGFLRKRIEEKERDRTEKYIKDVRALLDQYTLPTAAGVGAFLGTATIQAPDANGVIQVTGGSVAVAGDTMSLSVYAPTRAIRSAKVMTTYDGSEVNLTATYKTLANGLNYMAYATLSIPAKDLTIQVQNYDYINQNN